MVTVDIFWELLLAQSNSESWKEVVLGVLNNGTSEDAIVSPSEIPSALKVIESKGGWKHRRDDFLHAVLIHSMARSIEIKIPSHLSAFFQVGNTPKIDDSVLEIIYFRTMEMSPKRLLEFLQSFPCYSEFWQWVQENREADPYYKMALPDLKIEEWESHVLNLPREKMRHYLTCLPQLMLGLVKKKKVAYQIPDEFAQEFGPSFLENREYLFRKLLRKGKGIQAAS